MKESLESWLKRVDEAVSNVIIARVEFNSAKMDAISVGDFRGAVAKLDLVLFQGFDVVRPPDVVQNKKWTLTLEDLEV